MHHFSYWCDSVNWRCDLYVVCCVYVDVIKHIGCADSAVADGNTDVTVTVASITDDGHITVNIDTYDPLFVHLWYFSSAVHQFRLLSFHFYCATGLSNPVFLFLFLQSPTSLISLSALANFILFLKKQLYPTSSRNLLWTITNALITTPFQIFLSYVK